MEIHTYEKALEWIHGTLRLGIKPGLSRMQLMLEKLGHPEKAHSWIHVAGTNGKGSTLTFIRSMLEAEGYQVGTFTSPYIESFNERISVNGKPISNDEILLLVQHIKPIVEEIANSKFGPPSEFEIITAMMFLYFAKYHTAIDFGVIEVGLGGRLDSTNVLQPLISVITTVGLDHMEFLGNTLEQITAEKGGIIKQEIPIISGVLQPEAQTVLHDISQKKHAKIKQLGVDFQVKSRRQNTFTFIGETKRLPDLTVSLEGPHQVNNAAVAIATLLELKNSGQIHLSVEAIRSGLINAAWKGRMETLSKEPLIILDGAHNPEGIRAFKETVKQINEEKIILFSALQDKNYQEMIKELKTIPNSKLCLTTFDYPRAMTKEILTEVALNNQIEKVEDWQVFIKEQISSLDSTCLLITGSLYFIAEVRQLLTENILD
ncbi:folylpolyglutamate synthase/dihydrofolate synthase family protein [Listeria sp. PSOL-1]|uniref:bifunctional folylpolyglutamate synthase/dihydrofolate synthase n=1 Tax=Listeria sp. PSOL-1 TaxID=1844999 RepID=UPI0013D0CCBB|nr:folylpolyglutamate synthase/dihydrofolate synthase family protein [Listeria sp. PSOL-1]